MSEENIFVMKARYQDLRRLVADLHWMARRYADGRQSYVTSQLNLITRKLQEMGIELKAGEDGTVWARDSMGRAYDGLSAEEASEGKQVVEWKAWDEEEVAVLRNALLFYSNPSTYTERHEPFAYKEYTSFSVFPSPIEHDRGEVARKALKGKL